MALKIASAIWTPTSPITIRRRSTRTIGGKRLGVAAAVEADDLAGDVARFVPDEERARGGDVLGTAHAPHRGARDRALHVAEIARLLGSPEHRRVDETGGNGVDRDPLGAELECERLGEADDA